MPEQSGTRPGKKKKDLHGLVGRTVSGRYKVSSVLGVGGMGVVYKAYQATVHREVAIKVLMPEMIADETLIKRFELEARAASRLQHPNTITVYDFGRENELLYIVMELLIGDSVEDRIRRVGPIQPEAVAKITNQVLGSLGEAHSKGVVHRDIKPDNIFLQEFERKTDFVKVLDFGVAKLKDRGVQDVTLTQAGIIFGTPKYMSPEQAKAKGLDGRSDLYSLGVVMWEMLMGEVPFKAEDPVSILIQHVHDPPPYFRDVRPDLQIPEPLEAIVRKAMEKERENRYANAEEMQDALEEFINQAKAGYFGTAAQRALQTGASIPPQAGLQPSPTYPPSTTPSGGNQQGYANHTQQQHSSGPVSGPVAPSGPQGQHAANGGRNTWAADASQFDLAGASATTMVQVGGGKQQSTLLAALFILGLLLLCGIAFLIWRATGDGDDGDQDAGVVAVTDSGQVEEDAGTVDEPLVEADAGEAPDAGPEPTGDVSDEAVAVADTGGAPEPSEDTTSAEEPVAVVTSDVRIQFVASRPSSGLRYDFGDRAKTSTDDANIFVVSLTDGDSVRVRVRADGYRSRTYTIDLSAAENGIVEQTVRLSERSSDTTDRCIDPVTGFRDPYCRN